MTRRNRRANDYVTSGGRDPVVRDPLVRDPVGGFRVGDYRERRPTGLPDPGLPDPALLVNRQNCASFKSVILCPRSRSLLISISLRPPSLPAACSAFGRPRTMTVVTIEGPPCTMAPARRAAAIASARGRDRIPVNAMCRPLSERSTPDFSAAGGVLSAAISSSALS